MRLIRALGLTLTLVGAAGLALPGAAPSSPAGAYWMAVSASSDLRLVPRSHPGGAIEASAVRALTCASVVGLGVVDIGYRCDETAVIGTAAGPLPSVTLARADGG
ncbi:MAG TPA: hypothetical protein VNK52_10875 [Hyphomicrobiaceae bacterium]|nr:hypothetical protein [Hyphomicrobiaceae bacterium]